jgi:hypothetical protein
MPVKSGLSVFVLRGAFLVRFPWEHSCCVKRGHFGMESRALPTAPISHTAIRAAASVCSSSFRERRDAVLQNLRGSQPEKVRHFI